MQVYMLMLGCLYVPLQITVTVTLLCMLLCLKVNVYLKHFVPSFITQYTGTDIMVKNIDAKPGVGSVSLTWKAPRYLPHSYVITCACKLVDAEENYFNEEYLLFPSTLLFELNHLTNKSKCSLNFKAEYNPASLDAGITFTITTLDPGIQLFLTIFHCNLKVDENLLWK